MKLLDEIDIEIEAQRLGAVDASKGLRHCYQLGLKEMKNRAEIIITELEKENARLKAALECAVEVLRFASIENASRREVAFNSKQALSNITAILADSKE